MGTLAASTGFAFAYEQFGEQSDLPSGGQLLPRVPGVCDTQRCCRAPLCPAPYCSSTDTHPSSPSGGGAAYLHASSFCPHVETYDTRFVRHLHGWWRRCLWRALCYVRKFLPLFSSGMQNKYKIQNINSY